MAQPTLHEMLDNVMNDELAELRAAMAKHPLTDAQRIAYCDHLALQQQVNTPDPMFPRGSYA